MSTDRFSKAEFEQALTSALAPYSLSWVSKGIVLGEERYRVIIKTYGRGAMASVAEIASSIDATGYAQPTAENSIRVWLTDQTGAPLGNKVQRWVTRVSGWQGRLADVLGRVVEMGQAINYCPRCNSSEKIFVVKKDGPNKGRLFIKCGCSNSFSWLKEVDVAEQPAETASAPAPTTPVCPKCSKIHMVKRNGSRGAFWACTDRSCNGTVDFFEYDGQDLQTVPAYRKALAFYGKPVTKLDVGPKASKPLTEAYNAQADALEKAEDRAAAAAKLAAKFAKVQALTPNKVAEAVAPVAPAKFEPSPEQVEVGEWLKDTNNRTDKLDSLVVEAVAGSGKTTTSLYALNYVPATQKVLFLAFNKHIAESLAKKAPKHVQVSTYHSLGYSILRKAYGNIRVVDQSNPNEKINAILEGILDKYTHGHLFPVVRQLVSLVKGTLTETSDEALAGLSEYNGIELNGDAELIFSAVQMAVAKSVAMTNYIDYDDMCYIPVVNNLRGTLYDAIVIDEAQDTNRAQVALVMLSIKPNGRVMAVGDRYQSLYGFRGANVDAIPNLIDDLSADTLPLSVTFRNPKCVVRLVNREFPHIKFQAAAWAIEGVERKSSIDRMILELVTGNEDRRARNVTKPEDGDMVICRTNAPLVKPAFELISKGVKAVIRGRDIGKSLTVLVRKMRCDTLLDMLSKLETYRRDEVAKLTAANKGSQAQSLDDKVATIVALSDGVSTITELETRIENIFSDSNVGVVFSSVHRAKGLEAQRVYILHPELMPHPMARLEWEQQQEENIRYVAYTRTLNELIYVS